MFGSIGRVLGAYGKGYGSLARGFAGSPMGKSMLTGAAIGGAGGFLNGDGAGSVFGGALMGAGAGAAWNRWGAGKNLMSRGLGIGRNYAAGMALNKNATIRQGLFGRMAGGAHRVMSNRGINSFASKYGDRTLMGLGAASAGLIGGSIMSSNRGY